MGSWKTRRHWTAEPKIMLDGEVLVKVYENLLLPEQVRMETVSERSRNICLTAYVSQKLDFTLVLRCRLISPSNFVAVHRSRDLVQEFSIRDRPERRLCFEPGMFVDNLDSFLKRFTKFNRLTVKLGPSCLRYSMYSQLLLYRTRLYRNSHIPDREFQSRAETAHSMFCTVWYSDIPDFKS